MAKIRLIRGNDVFEFEGIVNQSVLDQALTRGVPASYSCKRGDCGQCGAKLIAGKLDCVDATRPLIAGEEVLLCNARARGDVSLCIPHFPELTSIQVKRAPCKVHHLTLLARDVMEVTLRLPPTTGFQSLPGQFIRIWKRSQVARSYSLSSAPSESGLLQIHVRRVEGGQFSEYWFTKAKTGDLLQIEGPHGRFFLRERQKNRVTLFLATGTGIAPINAILEGMNKETLQRLGTVGLYWGNRYRQDEYWAEHLSQLCLTRGIRYQPIYSREAAADGVARYVQDAVTQEYTSLEDAAAFACGSSQMIAAAKDRLVRLGLHAENFVADAFTAS
ncbi:CDP-6-deoxy-delta-3,4-glucoseen reductase [Steroidobacter agaridevorans]|uniref:CDP-6-deoxy-delta-3,4-glucoseen reductase n=1 Tax=Steroidobacter agaridevorans TaxID=2695856 RepID=A0A829YME5_9GAMM|nr:FAD-binding oxidoreductase [Steroidobacter agaridevorans]GFE83676.1 CDP-6-deoxy-delta-3,4-glucoseen reductase [Steroidobacter agaridevorans]